MRAREYRGLAMTDEEAVSPDKDEMLQDRIVIDVQRRAAAVKSVLA